MRFHSKPLLAALLTSLIMGAASNSAFAQSAEPVSPTSTTATFGDWIVRCRSVLETEIDKANNEQASKSIKEVCEMVHAIRVATRNEQTGQTTAPQLLAQIAIGKLPNSETFKVVYQLPSAVWLRDPIKVRFAEDVKVVGKAEGNYFQSVSYFRCQANACLADIDLTSAMIAAIKASKIAQLSFNDATRRTINIPISLNGFTGAFDALSK